MKKIVAILFVLIFLFNSMGYFVVFQLEQYAAREEMRNNIDIGLLDSRITVLTIDNNLVSEENTTFQKNGNEFTFKGQLFDIVKSEKKGNQTIFYAINDQKEEHLFSSLETHLASHNDGIAGGKQPISAKNLGKNLLKIYFFEAATYHLDSKTELNSFANTASFYQSIDKNAALLPPKLA